jgi:hypothetical protein
VAHVPVMVFLLPLFKPLIKSTQGVERTSQFRKV